MNKLTETFCDVDDFCKVFIPKWEQRLIEDGTRKRRREKRMTSSEIMTIIIGFHQSNYRDFKNYYLGFVSMHLKNDFPSLLSYTRFITVMPSVLIPLCSYLTARLGKPTGIAFVDSTKIEVCHIMRAKRNRVFDGIAKHGKGTMGWSFGFKLHLIVNHLGEILAVKLTEGNVDDRKPVPDMVTDLSGKLFGDKGYLSNALSAELWDKGIELLTNVRKNMKKKAMSLWDRALLKKRFIIETINDQLKNISYIEHSRHRSISGFMINLLAGLIAYCVKKNKPSLDLNVADCSLIETSAMVVA